MVVVVVEVEVKVEDFVVVGNVGNVEVVAVVVVVVLVVVVVEEEVHAWTSSTSSVPSPSCAPYLEGSQMCLRPSRRAYNGDGPNVCGLQT